MISFLRIALYRFSLHTGRLQTSVSALFVWTLSALLILSYGIAVASEWSDGTPIVRFDERDDASVQLAAGWKGLPERHVVLRHAFKNALIPVLTILGPLTASMVTGSFFIETIFRIPGIGNQLTFSIYNRDYPIIMALTLLWSAVIAFAYLITDILYAAVDPRVRLGGSK